MPTLTIIRGLPGSGKSTLARKIAAETGAIHIEPDMFCIQDGEYRYNPEKYNMAYHTARSIIMLLANEMKCDIIFADVLPQTAQVDSFRYLIPSNYKLVVKDLHISKEESLKRNKHNVRPEDIETMAAGWQNWNSQQTTNSSQLPKLTAEVFDRPDCPEWAKYAAVDIDCNGWFFETKPQWMSDGHWFIAPPNKKQVIDGEKFSYVNWRESRIERPKKKKKELSKGIPLPDWVEVGAYAYFDSKYHKITSIQTEGVSTPVVSFDTGEDLPWGSVRFDEVKEARIVPWIGDLSFCVGKVFKRKGVAMLCLASVDDRLGFFGGNEYKAKELLEKGVTFADGSLCGEFEHLEYDPIDECFDWVN